MPKPLKRISYVEDEHDIRAVAALALTTVGGFEIDIAVDGDEALRRIPAYRPDLVLLDVMMPGLTGRDVFERLKADPAVAAVPVVFMTARAQRHEIEGYLASGAAGVIPKPFDPMTLHEEVRAIWDSATAATPADAV